MNQVQLEAKLRERLLADRRHKSRLRDGGDGTIIVTPSGTALGLAIAISHITGEDDEAVMNRVMAGTEDPWEARTVIDMGERWRAVAELMLYAARIEPADWAALAETMGSGWTQPVSSAEIRGVAAMTLAGLLPRRA